MQLHGLGEGGHAVWIVRTRGGAAVDSLYLAHEGVVDTLPMVVGRFGPRTAVVGPDGEVLTRAKIESGLGLVFWREGESRQFEDGALPVGFTEDGRAWMSTFQGASQGLAYWDGAELVELGAPRAEFVAPDGGLLYSGGTYGQGVPRGSCVIEHGGERHVIFAEAENMCFPLDIASGRVALLAMETASYVWIDGRLTSTDEMAWMLRGPRVPIVPFGLRGINRHGDAIGIAGDVPVLVRDGEIWGLDALDDPDDGWVWIDALDINDRGEILATGRNDAGETAIVLLTLAR